MSGYVGTVDPNRGGWSAVHVGEDTEPTKVVPKLQNMVNKEFGGNTERASQELVHEHPEGYRTLKGLYFDLESGLPLHDGPMSHPAACYCHGDPDIERHDVIDRLNVGDSDHDWGYIIHPEGIEIHNPPGQTHSWVKWDEKYDEA